MTALCFRVDGKRFEMAAFWKRWRQWSQFKSRDFPDRVFHKHKSKMTGDCFGF